jgi:hypothetical protein
VHEIWTKTAKDQNEKLTGAPGYLAGLSGCTEYWTKTAKDQNEKLTGAPGYLAGYLARLSGFTEFGQKRLRNNSRRSLASPDIWPVNWPDYPGAGLSGLHLGRIIRST